jgi:hypothetical protein
VAQCGHPQPTKLSITFGKHESGEGVNVEEFYKYIMNAILPLYPDARNIPGKVMLLKIDMGVGRDNMDLIVELENHGFRLLSSVPNATHVMQEMDGLLLFGGGAYLRNTTPKI